MLTLSDRFTRRLCRPQWDHGLIACEGQHSGRRAGSPGRYGRPVCQPSYGTGRRVHSLGDLETGSRRANTSNAWVPLGRSAISRRAVHWLRSGIQPLRIVPERGFDDFIQTVEGRYFGWSDVLVIPHSMPNRAALLATLTRSGDGLGSAEKGEMRLAC